MILQEHYNQKSHEKHGTEPKLNEPTPWSKLISDAADEDPGEDMEFLYVE